MTRNKNQDNVDVDKQCFDTNKEIIIPAKANTKIIIAVICKAGGSKFFVRNNPIIKVKAIT